METARKAIIGRAVSEYELMLDKRANEKETELRTQIKRFVFFSYVKIKCSHNISIYLA